MRRLPDTFHRFLVVNAHGEAWQDRPPFKKLSTAALRVRRLNADPSPDIEERKPYRVVHLIPAEPPG